MSRSFNGIVSNQISIGDVADVTGTLLSISAWARPAGTGDGMVVAKDGGTAATDIQYRLWFVSGKAQANIGDSAGQDAILGATSFTANVWHHLGLRKNGTGATSLAVFLDGVRDAQGSSARSIQNTIQPIKIGARSGASGLPFNGLIAEVAVWDVALTDLEFAALAKGGDPSAFRRDHLVGYWPLPGVAFPEIDLSGLRNNGPQTGTVPAGTSHPPVQPVAVL